MKAIYDSKEKWDCLVNLAINLADVNLVDFSFLDVVYIKVPCSALCFTFKHNVSQQNVCIVLSLHDMKAFLCPSLNEAEDSLQTVPVDAHCLVERDKQKNLTIEINDFSFLIHCKSPFLCMAVGALVSAKCDFFQSLFHHQTIKPAQYKNDFGYFMNFSWGKGVFLKVDFYSNSCPFIFIDNYAGLKLLLRHPWKEPLQQPSNQKFFYYDGSKFLSRNGKFLSANETKLYLKQCPEGMNLYNYPIAAYVNECPVWIIGTLPCVRQYKFYLPVFIMIDLSTGKVSQVKSSYFKYHGYLASASDEKFIF